MKTALPARPGASRDMADAASATSRRHAASPAMAWLDDSPRQQAQRRTLHAFDPASRSAPPMATAAQSHSVHGSSAPVQREVRNVWGKWKSTFDMSKVFASEAEARAFDDIEAAKAAKKKEVDDALAAEAAEQAWAAAADKVAWRFADAEGRLTLHFKDGWGAAYKITSYAQIKQAIIDGDGSTEEGRQEVYLGDHKNTKTKQLMGCNILYENVWVTVSAGGITRDTIQSVVFHCGPGKGAG